MGMNGERYADPTADTAISHAMRDSRKRQRKAKKVIETVKDVIYLSGFALDGYITLRDRETGKQYKYVPKSGTLHTLKNDKEA